MSRRYCTGAFGRGIVHAAHDDHNTHKHKHHTHNKKNAQGPDAKQDWAIHSAKLATEELFVKSGQTLAKGSKICDMGSAYGGTARHAARTYGCEVSVSRFDSDITAGSAL